VSAETQINLSRGADVWRQWLTRRGVGETLVGAIAFLVYIPTLGFEFIYDDKPQIIQNPAIHAWRYLPTYFTSHAWAELYPHVSGNYYRPLFLLWFRLNHALFGLDPVGWHLTTVLCHVAATCLVLILIRRMTESPLTALGAATLFALHPVHIESVAWISGVTDPLMAVFLIGSFLAYLRWRERLRWGWMAAALALFVLGLLVKETAVVLGPLVFVYAWLYAQERAWIPRFKFALKHSVGFFGLTLLYLPWRAHVLRGLSHSVTPLSLRSMALTEPSILWLYVRHLLFPAGLSGLYGLPYVVDPASAQFLFPAAMLLALVVVLAWGIRRLEDNRLALFACCWMVLPILPALWLRAYAEGDIAHDRYLYIPSVGFVLLVALFLAEISRRSGAGRPTRPFAAFAVLALGYAFGTIAQQSYWATDLLLYQRAYKIAPRDNLICNDLGTALMETGNPAQAMALYSQVLSREPGFWLANYNLGYAYYKLGRFQDAEASLRRAIAINAADSDEFVYLGLSLWRQGRTEEAAQFVQQAIEIRPSAPGYHFALAMIRRDQNDVTSARSELSLELQYHPENIVARQQLEALDHPAP